MKALTLALVLFASPSVASERMVASYYWHGARTANGERFNPEGMTAAHKTWPFGTKVEVCFRGCVTVRINDRGPFIPGRSIDLARGAARVIGLAPTVGVAGVRVKVLSWGRRRGSRK